MDQLYTKSQAHQTMNQNLLNITSACSLALFSLLATLHEWSLMFLQGHVARNGNRDYTFYLAHLCTEINFSAGTFKCTRPNLYLLLVNFHYCLFDPSFWVFCWLMLGVSMPFKEGMFSSTLGAKAGIAPWCCRPSDSIAASDEDLCSETWGVMLQWQVHMKLINKISIILYTQNLSTVSISRLVARV